MKKKTKKTKKFILVFLLGLLLTGVACVGTVYYYLFAPQFHPQKTVYIYIDRDDTTDSIFSKIEAEANVRHFAGFLWMAQHYDYSKNIHTGRYAIRPGENAYRVFNRLRRNRQEPINLTIGSVRTLDRLARSVGKQLMIDSAEIVQLMNDSLFQHEMGYRNETLPCLFIPETYQVYWDMNVKEFFERMQKEHKKFWNQERLDKAKSIGMTAEEVCTLASIVEEETNNNAEKPLVAGLYINRLHRDMPLQADPTVKFALQNFGLRRITNEHLATKSAYNTYANTGLPPGPIRIPTPIGLDAVLNYTKHNYIYMCAKEDFSGTHNFASNYDEHIRNARKYWKALNERKIFN